MCDVRAQGSKGLNLEFGGSKTKKEWRLKAYAASHVYAFVHVFLRATQKKFEYKYSCRLSMGKKADANVEWIIYCRCRYRFTLFGSSPNEIEKQSERCYYTISFRWRLLYLKIQLSPKTKKKSFRWLVQSVCAT